MVATTVKRYKKEIPAMLPFQAILSESLDFKASYVLLIPDP
jgi:hypothetical protein